MAEIYGVEIRELIWHKDERGRLAELYRESWHGRTRQCYCTTAGVGVTKDVATFHMHKLQRDYFVVLRGKIKLILVDIRKGSETFGNKMEIILDSEKNFKAVIIPKNVAHKFQNIGDEECFIINCIDKEYKPVGHPQHDEFRIPNEEVEKCSKDM